MPHMPHPGTLQHSGGTLDRLRSEPDGVQSREKAKHSIHLVGCECEPSVRSPHNLTNIEATIVLCIDGNLVVACGDTQRRVLMQWHGLFLVVSCVCSGRFLIV